MDSTDASKGQSLLVLATEGRVHAFDLARIFRIAIGRHDSNTLQLESQIVSSYHAEIVNERGRLTIRDLDSTNGTFVNGERIDVRRLENGDRIAIGSYVLTVRREAPIEDNERFLRVPRDPSTFEPGATGRIVSLRTESIASEATLQIGGPNDRPLADLLKVLSENARTVLLVLTQDEGQGFIWFRKGRVVHATLGVVTGEKALYRIFAWRNASYEIQALPEDGRELKRTIDLPIDTLIVEGMRHVSEVGRLLGRLPPMESVLKLQENCHLPPSAYTPGEFRIFQDIIRYQTLARVLELSPMPDTTVLRVVDGLLRKGVFGVGRRWDHTLDERSVPVRR